MTKDRLSFNATNMEVLTDLRHFGGDTTLVDFSRSLFVALFFACNGKFEKDGELIALNTDGSAELSDIDYEDCDLKISFLRPSRTELSRARVEFQSSVFVHTPEGHVPQSYYRTFSVPGELKGEILRHLQELHNISHDTIYNDLIGFVQNQENIETPMILFFRGSAKFNLGHYQNAIVDYDEAIHWNPGFVEAYGHRGNAKSELGLYIEAIVDYDEVIRLRPDDEKAYYNRGGAKLDIGFHRGDLNFYEDAIFDFSQAILLNPDFLEAYNNRGIAKEKLDYQEDAISDFDEVISRRPDYARTYLVRGTAKANLKRFDEARRDVERALALAIDQDNQELADEAQRILAELQNRLV